MEPRRAKSVIKLPPLNNQGETATIPRIEALTPVRKSARLQYKQRLYQQPEVQEQLLSLSSPTSITPDQEVCSAVLQFTI